MNWLVVLVAILLGCGGNSEVVTLYQISDHGITITASSRLAGAIESITYEGKEFLIANDHGRGLQSATSYDYKGESYNPTEAGSSADLFSSESTSKLIAIRKVGALETQTQMAFWLPVGEKVLSDHVLFKRVEIIGPNTIQYDVQFYVPRDYSHGCLEILTGYMPPGFNTFLTVGGVEVSHGPGEIREPLIFTDGTHAMGIYTEWVNSYGRFNCIETMKWNSVYRKENIKAGYYGFRSYVYVGRLEDVQGRMR